MPRGESDTYGEPTDARERRRRGVVTIVVVGLLLFSAAWYALSYARADETRPAPSPSGSTTACADPADVTVNVYNATSRDGLAALVAKDLRARGFVVRTVANDPKGRELTGVAEIRHGTKGDAGARVVAAHVGGAEDVPDTRQRSTVDLVLGPRFTSLADGGRVASRGC